jgi:hypothetical protein
MKKELKEPEELQRFYSWITVSLLLGLTCWSLVGLIFSYCTQAALKVMGKMAAVSPQSIFFRSIASIDKIFHIFFLLVGLGF